MIRLTILTYGKGMRFLYVYITKFKHQKTNRLINEELSKLGYRNAIIRHNKYGKKYIDDNVFFNVSHSSSILALVISNKEVGIDCECKHTDLLLPELKKVLNEDLFNVIDFYSKEPTGLIKFWTVLEAFIKCVGFGFCKELNYFSINPKTNIIYNFLDDTNYNFSTFEYQENYVTICTKDSLKECTIISD